MAGSLIAPGMAQDRRDELAKGDDRLVDDPRHRDRDLHDLLASLDDDFRCAISHSQHAPTRINRGDLGMSTGVSSSFGQVRGIEADNSCGWRLLNDELDLSEVSLEINCRRSHHRNHIPPRQTGKPQRAEQCESQPAESGVHDVSPG